jgi:hypothetical protein
MVDAMKENGNKIICMEKEFTPGQMEGNTMGTMLMTKNKDMEFIDGLMEDNILVIGNKENNMEKGHTHYPMELLRKEFGKRANDYYGKTIQPPQDIDKEHIKTYFSYKCCYEYNLNIHEFYLTKLINAFVSIFVIFKLSKESIFGIF